MLPKEEAKQLRREFWEGFNHRMSKLRPRFEGAAGWVPYQVRVRGIMFRQDFTNKEAVMSFEMRHPDPDIRELHWEQFLEVRKLLEAELGHELYLDPELTDPQGITMARVHHSLEGCSMFDPNTWEDAEAYLSHNLRAFDRFWSEFFDLFKVLEK